MAASKLAEAFVEITGRDADLKRAFSDAKKGADKTSRLNPKVKIDADTTAMQGKLAGVAAGIAGLMATAGLAGMLNRATQEAISAEDAQMRLVTALALTGEATPAVVDKLQEFASAMQEVTTAEDDQVIAGMGMLKEMGIQTSELERATKAAITLSAVSGTDLASAFQQVGAANNGVTRAFMRYVPGLRAAKTETEKMSLILDWGTRNFGIAESRAKTFSGATEQLKNAIGNLYEFIGGLLLPVLMPMAQWAKSITNWFNNLDDATKGVVGGLASIVGIALAVISAIAGIAAAFRALALAEVAQAIASWAKKNPAVAIAAATAIGLAMAGAASATGKAMRDAGKNTDQYIKDTQAAIAASGGLMGARTAAVKSSTAATEDLSKQQAKQFADEAKQKRDTFAERVLQRVQALRQQREEEEKAKAAAIGWKSIGDIWKEGAVAGLQQRFRGESVIQRSILFGTDKTLGDVSTREAFDAARAEQNAERRHRELITKLGNLAPGYGGV